MSGDDRPAAPAGEGGVIPVLQEELAIHKRRVETDAGVRITKQIAERDQVVDVPLVHEDVEVERIAVNRAIDEAPAVRHEGDTMIVPVVEEVLVVEKRLMLKEEIRITRHRRELREPRRVTLRSEHAQVERIEAAPHEIASGDATAGDAAANLIEEKRRQDEGLRRDLNRPA